MTHSEQPKARWETYADEIIGKDSAEMEAAVAAYAKNRHAGKSTTESEETLAFWKERNDNIAKEYQWVDPKDYQDFEARRGRIFSYEQFINKLRDDCKLKCFYREMGHPQKLALWAFKNGETEPVMACWVQRSFMIEFEIPHFDDHGVILDSKYRGWRTCLMQLRLKDILPEKTINKVFGRANGPASEKYNQFMQSMRKNY